MKDLRVEITDEGSALYVAVDPDGQWARTTQPDDLITIDWDRQGRVIGVEAIGSAARQAIHALLQAIADYHARDRDSVTRALDSIIGSSSTQESDVKNAPEAPGNMRTELIAALSDLPPNERAIFMLHEEKHFSVSKIAASMNTTDASVNSALQRASDQLAAAGWHSPERAALATRLLRDIDWAEIGIFELISERP
jgi:DNA-directed RNA polymerase specialized sigma24 family protein